MSQAYPAMWLSPLLVFPPQTVAHAAPYICGGTSHINGRKSPHQARCHSLLYPGPEKKALNYSARVGVGGHCDPGLAGHLPTAGWVNATTFEKEAGLGYSEKQNTSLEHFHLLFPNPSPNLAIFFFLYRLIFLLILLPDP